MENKSEREMAIAFFNSCWQLIDNPSRSTEDDAQMLHLAHASRLHWGNVGGAQERAIGEWQCSHVYAILGMGEPALLHAKLSAGIAAQIPAPHFMHASATQALAFAHFLLGERELALELREQALIMLDGVDEQDAAHIRNQIAVLPF